MVADSLVTVLLLRMAPVLQRCCLPVRQIIGGAWLLQMAKTYLVPGLLSPVLPEVQGAAQGNTLETGQVLATHQHATWAGQRGTVYARVAAITTV